MTSATIERPATKRSSVKSENDAKAKAAKVAKRPSPVKSVKAPKVAKVAKVAKAPKTFASFAHFSYADVKAEKGKTQYAATTGHPKRTYLLTQIGKADQVSYQLTAVFDAEGKSLRLNQLDRGLLSDFHGLAEAGKAIAGWTVNVRRTWHAVGNAPASTAAPKRSKAPSASTTRERKVKTREAFPLARGSKTLRQCFGCMDSYPIADFDKFTKDGVIMRCPKVAKHTRAAILESMR